MAGLLPFAKHLGLLDTYVRAQAYARDNGSVEEFYGPLLRKIDANCPVADVTRQVEAALAETAAAANWAVPPAA